MAMVGWTLSVFFFPSLPLGISPKMIVVVLIEKEVSDTDRLSLFRG
jgi:hypothetical protein